uniref:helix-turn-helix domain-containing protein n=1 Tax=Candidatus Fimenecus sp. TaxID=3022888 RepID=UPI0040296318
MLYTRILQKGKSYREIAGLVGRNVSTISRELNRNFIHMYDIPTYYPHTAHKKYLFRRLFSFRCLLLFFHCFSRFFSEPSSTLRSICFSGSR